jgi:hypothetical protein
MTIYKRVSQANPWAKCNFIFELQIDVNKYAINNTR